MRKKKTADHALIKDLRAGTATITKRYRAAICREFVLLCRQKDELDDHGWFDDITPLRDTKRKYNAIEHRIDYIQLVLSILQGHPDRVQG